MGQGSVANNISISISSSSSTSAAAHIGRQQAAPCTQRCALTSRPTMASMMQCTSVTRSRRSSGVRTMSSCLPASAGWQGREAGGWGGRATLVDRLPKWAAAMHVDAVTRHMLLLLLAPQAAAPQAGEHAAHAMHRAPILKKSRKLETVDSRMEPDTRIVLASSRWSSCGPCGAGWAGTPFSSSGRRAGCAASETPCHTFRAIYAGRAAAAAGGPRKGHHAAQENIKQSGSPSSRPARCPAASRQRPGSR